MKPRSSRPTTRSEPGIRPISYQLVVAVARPLRLTVGRLGCFDFPAGTYAYTGSARRAFEARIARHLRPEKALRWHIDYLLAAPGVRVVRVVRSVRPECTLHRSTRGLAFAAGFGASDCRAGCGSHLKRVSGRPRSAPAAN